MLLRGFVVVASVWSFRYGANAESWARRKSSSFKSGLGTVVLIELLALARFNMVSLSLTSSSAFLPSSPSLFVGVARTPGGGQYMSCSASRSATLVSESSS